jgi:aminoglycoside phosphotransferase (APT) family kinase protein
LEQVTGGWDSRAFIVEGAWLEREPLRPDVTPRLVTETRLLPWLAPQLPLPVPLPQVVQEEPLRVRHRLIPGNPTQHLTGDQGTVLGGFFRVLHTVDSTAAVSRGVPPEDAVWCEHLERLERFRRDVVPMIPGERLRRRGEALLDRLARPPHAPALVHGDVGPAHILVLDGTVSGVIDWSDAHVGDPAIDLAWLLHASSASADVAEEYGADAALLERAHDWHMLGPWHEVIHGLDIAGSGFVQSGMAGVLSRLSP